MLSLRVVGRALLLTTAVAVLLPRSAHAQGGFEVQQFHPAPNLDNDFLAGLSGTLIGAQAYRVALMWSYVSNPFVLDDVSRLDPGYDPIRGQVVTSQNVLHLTGAYGVFDWLEFGVDVPLILRQTGEPLTGLTSPNAIDASFGLGDVRVIPRIALLELDLSRDSSLRFAAMLDAGLPTGRTEKFQGGGLRLEPMLAAEWRLPWRIRLGGNVGYIWRERSVDTLGVEVDDELSWSVALDLPVVSRAGPIDRVGLVAEVFQELSREAVVGAKISALGFSGLVGFGAGLDDDPATPDWRTFVALGYGGGFGSDVGYASRGRRFGDRDGDGDGVSDESDRCPDEPEDLDGFEDGDGCPDEDNDADGIADARDACPMEPEDVDAFQDDDGCPDLDNDGDGITDRFDRCMFEPEDRDGFEDGDGCPEADNDADGIADADDGCPMDPEDFDHDRDEDGCPDFEQSMSVDVVVYFGSDSEEIAPEQFYELDRVANTLIAAPDSLHVWLEGHADDSGSPQHNLELSQRRSANIRNYLIGRGVPATKITTVAYGETKGVRENLTELDRYVNRRVEFRVGPRSSSVRSPPKKSAMPPQKSAMPTPTTTTSTKAYR